MTVATAGNSPGSVPLSVEIKSAQLSVLALTLKTDDLATLAQDLATRFGPDGDSPDFFDNEGVVIDFSRLPQADTPDLSTLMALLRQYRLVPLAVRGASEPLEQAALAAGLVLAPEVVRPVTRPVVPPVEMEAAVVEVEVVPPPVATVVAAPVATLVIDKPLRSGQKVYARGGDLVVMAMVNPGAEVVADGNIHVYAPLRGKAIAGARGDANARIFALGMEPELISIAGIYRTSENPLPADVHGKPAQIRLGGPEGDKLLFEPLKA